MNFLILFISLLSLSQLDGRPSPSEENEGANKEMEYQGENDPGAEEYNHDEQNQQMVEDQEDIPRNAHQENKEDFIKSEEKRAARSRLAANKFSDLKSGREINEENDQNINVEDNVAIPTNGQHMNIYRDTYEVDNNNQPMKVLSLASHNMYNPQDHDDVDPKQIGINYQPVEDEEGDNLFENRRNHKEPNNYQYKHESQYMENQRIPKREYYQSSKRIRVEKRYDNSPKIERDRRQIQKSRNNINDTPNENESNVAGALEDNEAAIKNKIKKLSKEELEDLLNSLSEDKKTLLKKVIDDKDLPNKREITKKAGAVGENNFIENSQVDIRNSQDECVSAADADLPVSQNTEVTIPSTLNESNDTTSTQASDTDKNIITDKSNNAEIVDKTSKSDIDLRNTNLDVKNDDNLNDNCKASVKNENKRDIDLNNQEVNLKDDTSNAIGSSEYQDLSNQNGIYKNNEEYADLMNSESLPDDISESLPEVKSVNKRENEEEMSFDNAESLKCLQDSFPSENEKSNLKSDLVPLIRVKRTDLDHSDKKRDTKIMANIKVPFFPDAENENLDNDERSEFEDYGIFDRKTHLTRKDQFEDSDKSKIETICQREPNMNTNEARSSEDNSKMQIVKSDMDDMKLGSDTDSVLTGAEGVDENIMFNSGLRNKRAVDKNSKIPENKYLARFGRTVEPLEMNPVVENNVNIQECINDETVGAQPRKNEGDVSRYKRIRDVKQNLG